MNFSFFVSLLGWALLLMVLLPRLKAGHALLCALCGMLFVSYYGVIVARVMTPVAMVLMIGGFCALGVGIVSIIMNRRGMRQRVCAVGMLAYLILAVGGAIALQGYVISDHDSLSYWARIVKELFTHERFPIHGDSTMAHMDYIPLLASLQYCVVRFGGWQDAALVYVTLACVICAIAAMADLLSEHKGWAAVTAVLLVYAYVTLGSPLFSTRADGPISALFAAGLICLFMRRDDHPTAWLPTFCVTAVLAGFKIYTGLMLAVVMGASMLLSVAGAAKSNKALRRPLLMLSVVALALSVAMQLSWSGIYHYASRVADYEAAIATAAYTGIAADAARPVFTLRDLFAGNPRNEALASTLNAESFQRVGRLAGETFAAYGQSRLIWLQLFFLPVAAVWAVSEKKERRAMLALAGAMLLAAALYLLGLFASYFVQAETAAAAVSYLVTVSTPLLMALVFMLVKAAAAGKARMMARITLPVAAAGMLMLFPPTSFAEQVVIDNALTNYAVLAEEYYTGYAADQLTPEDASTHALLIDCSYAAADIKSESGITHAYQYYGMPLYVHVLQYPCGNYDSLGMVDYDALKNMLDYNRCDLLLLRVEDDIYWSELQNVLTLEGDWVEPTAVYDVVREDGEISFQCRAEE